jgi:hypothetical protein
MKNTSDGVNDNELILNEFKNNYFWMNQQNSFPIFFIFFLFSLCFLYNFTHEQEGLSHRFEFRIRKLYFLMKQFLISFQA